MSLATSAHPDRPMSIFDRIMAIPVTPTRDASVMFSNLVDIVRFRHADSFLRGEEKLLEVVSLFPHAVKLGRAILHPDLRAGLDDEEWSYLCVLFNFAGERAPERPSVSSAAVQRQTLRDGWNCYE